MHRAFLLMTLTLSAVLVLQAARADPAGDARVSIQAAYDKRNAALARFSIEGYLAVDSASYHEMSQAHPKTLDEQRQAIISLMARAERLFAQETVQSVAMIGKDALVELRGRGTLVARSVRARKPAVIMENYAGRAFWISTPQGWRLKQERTLSSRSRFAGRSLAGGSRFAG